MPVSEKRLPTRSGTDQHRHRFAAKMRAGRAILGWSQRQLAAKASLTQRSIYRLEKGDVDVRVSTMVRIDRVFQLAGITFQDSDDGGFLVIASPRSLARESGRAKKRPAEVE